MMQDVGFVLLAGGQSRRMGGGDKNLIELAGKPVLRHVLDRVDFANRPIMLNANGDPARYAGYGLPVISDVIEGYAGPLAGILTGLEWLAAEHPHITHMVSLATDAPFLPVDLAPRLYQRLGPDASIVQAQSNGQRHPVFAIWPVALAADLRRAVCDEGVRKIDHFTARHACDVVAFSGTPDPFLNLNRPEDFVEAEEWLAQLS
ncbi:MAG: molybdenum cofactor guanylyltransferase MobA [Candidatus Puniceispirillaceae bacterium]